jgi:hypothetical protein
MSNKLKVKNKQFERMGIRKKDDGNYEYIDKNNKALENNVVADPKEMQRALNKISELSD